MEDFIRILTEPKSSLVKQYTALLETEGVKLEFTRDSLEEVAKFAFRVNEGTENIGARRLHTIMLQAQPTADGVVLTWPGELNAASNPDLTYSYRIYRRREGTIERVIIGDIARGPDVQPSLVDRTFAWETHYEYWLTVVTHVKPTGSNCGNTGSSPSQACREIEVEGENSATFKIFTRDVFPPAIPTGLQAVFSGPGQKSFIDLVWAPDTDADLAGYNAYRREENSTAVKLNSDLLKAPAFRDTNVVSGKTYWYSVSAVDARGNESSRSDEASETVP